MTVLICMELHKCMMFPVKTLFTLAFLLLGKVQGDCPPRAHEYNGFCYELAHVRTTWAQANLYCHAFGMHLITIKTMDENNFVVNMIRQVTDHWNDDSVWLGASDIQTEGHFTWVDTSDMVTFTNWHPGNPDNGDDHDEHCVVMKKNYDFQWNDDNCESSNYFVCKSQKTQTGFIG